MTLLPKLPISFNLPKGYHAVPIENAPEASLRIAVLVADKIDAVSPLIVLKDEIDTRIFLGCVIDRKMQVHQWVEIWVQSAGAWVSSPRSHQDRISNAVLDRRFMQMAAAGIDDFFASSIANDWEQSWDKPLFIDREERCMAPVCETWRLCRDDEVLTEHELPAFSSSLHRYLVNDKGDLFIPVTSDAPANHSTIGAVKVFDPSLMALNPEGGLMSVKPYFPLSLSEYLDILNGESWIGYLHGRNLVDLEGWAEALGTEGMSGRLFLGSQGSGSWMLETLLLKLQLVRQLFHAVAHQVECGQQPMFNLSEDSFRVTFGPMGEYLPFLWNARSALAKPGDAITLPIPNAPEKYFISTSPANLSIYRPENTGHSTQGEAMIRIRGLADDSRSGKVVQGTFQTRVDIPAAGKGLAWFRINLKSLPMEVYAHLEKEEGASPGDWRFQSLGMTLDDEVASEFESAAGVSLQNVPFEFIPSSSSPCDLYAMAVLSARILLGDDPQHLSAIWDDVLKLGRTAGHQAASREELPGIIEKLLPANDWMKTLAPDHLCKVELTPKEALALLPPDLWWEVLAMLICMIPGLHAWSTCSHYGDAPGAGLARVFDPGLKALDDLIRKVRACIVPEGGGNQEIQDVIKAFMKRCS